VTRTTAQRVGSRFLRPGALWRALGRRISAAALVLWGAASLAFLVLAAVPGDPVDIMLGPHSTASPEARADIRERWGLNLPLWQQYLLALWRPLTGDFGISYQQQRPVTAILAEQLPHTLLLAVVAMALAIAIAVGAAAFTRRGIFRSIVQLLEPVAVAAPTFWLALTLASVFSYGLGWFPAIGGNPVQQLVLPAIALALPLAGTLGQLLRDGLDEADRQPFAETARARGLGTVGLVWRHTLRHAASGTVTMAGTLFGWLLGGAVLVESVFARPGLGRVALDAIMGRDLQVVMALVLFAGVVFVIITLVVDALVAFLDPRTRRGGDRA